MSNIRLFRVNGDDVEPIEGSAVAVEKSLQTLIEKHLEAFFGVRFLASEYATTKSHGGRIDTLGLDDSNCPVIVEYKRALNENVINQGLFYLNWLMDHRGDFQLLVMEKLGAGVAGQIEWRYPRLVCIAGDFTKYDEHAIHQMPRNIDLIRYRRYDDDLILLERMATSSAPPPVSEVKSAAAHLKLEASGQCDDGDEDRPPAVIQRLNQCSPEVHDWFHTLKAFILGLGEGIEERTLKDYIVFRQLKNFAYFRFRPTLNRIVVDVPLPSSSVRFEEGFTQPMKGGSVRILIDDSEDVERAQPLIVRGYREA